MEYLEKYLLNREEEYLNFPCDSESPESNKADRLRATSMGPLVYFLCNNESGNCLNMNSEENSTYTHAFKSTNNENAASVSGDCIHHQDWMSRETLVFAFSLHREGVRVMLQMTMRIQGEGNADKALAALRKYLF